jgi:hypothetical protein
MFELCASLIWPLSWHTHLLFLTPFFQCCFQGSTSRFGAYRGFVPHLVTGAILLAAARASTPLTLIQPQAIVTQLQSQPGRQDTLWSRAAKVGTSTGRRRHRQRVIQRRDRAENGPRGHAMMPSGQTLLDHPRPDRAKEEDGRESKPHYLGNYRVQSELKICGNSLAAPKAEAGCDSGPEPTTTLGSLEKAFVTVAQSIFAHVQYRVCGRQLLARSSPGPWPRSRRSWID